MKYKSTIWQADQQSLEDHSAELSADGWTIFQIIEPRNFVQGLRCHVLWQKAEPKRIREQHPFVPPTIEEVQAFIDEKKFNIDARTFFTFYAKRDWYNSVGRRVRNWKQAMIHNWLHDNPVGFKEDYTKPKTN